MCSRYLGTCNYIVSLSPESFELLKRYSAGLLAFPSFVCLLVRRQWLVERKLSLLMRVGITVAGTAPDLIYLTGIPF